MTEDEDENVETEWYDDEGVELGNYKEDSVMTLIEEKGGGDDIDFNHDSEDVSMVEDDLNNDNEDNDMDKYTEGYLI